jgi:leucyl aminopeptidase (aminopeptidase T)
MLARMLGAPLAATRARSATLTAALTRATSARMTCPRGTELTFDLAERPGNVEDGDLTAPRAFANLPFGESYVAPVTASGTLVASSISAFGLAVPRTRLRVEQGLLVDGSERAGEWLMEQLGAHGRDGRTIAELGVGTNEHARITGNVLEDEKALGTAHVAFGASVGFGGTVDVPIHIDCVVCDASVWLDEEPIVLEGRWCARDA